MLYDEIDVDNVSNGVIVLNGLEEIELVICAVFVTFDEDDTDKVADVEPDKDAVPEIEEDSETEYVNEGDCEIDGDTVNDSIDETEGLEEELTSTDAEVDSKLDGVTEVVETKEFDAKEADCEGDDEADTVAMEADCDGDGEADKVIMEADCEGDSEADKVADVVNVFVSLGFTEFLGVNVLEPTVVVAVIIELSVTDGDEEVEAHKLTLADDDDEL